MYVLLPTWLQTENISETKLFSTCLSQLALTPLVLAFPTSLVYIIPLAWSRVFYACFITYGQIVYFVYFLLFASDCLVKLVYEMTYYALSGT